MTPELMFLNYEKIDTNRVGERLFRGRVFQGHIVGVSLRDISPSTMTIVDILENFPQIIYLGIHHGVTLEALGDLKRATNIISMRAPLYVLSGCLRLPPRISALTISLDCPVLTSQLVRVLKKLLKNLSCHLTLGVANCEHLVPDADLLTGLGDFNVSLCLHRT